MIDVQMCHLILKNSQNTLNKHLLIRKIAKILYGTEVQMCYLINQNNKNVVNNNVLIHHNVQI